MYGQGNFGNLPRYRVRTLRAPRPIVPTTMGMIQPISKPRSPHSAIDALIEARLVLCLCISVSMFVYFYFDRTYLPRWDAELRQCQTVTFSVFRLPSVHALLLILSFSSPRKPTGVVLLNIHCIALRRVLLVLISSE